MGRKEDSERCDDGNDTGFVGCDEKGINKTGESTWRSFLMDIRVFGLEGIYYHFLCSSETSTNPKVDDVVS